MPSRGARRDVGIAVILGLVASAVYALTWQPSWYGDGIWILRVAAGESAKVQHPLLATVAIGLQRAVPALGPIEALRTKSRAAASGWP